MKTWKCIFQISQELSPIEGYSNQGVSMESISTSFLEDTASLSSQLQMEELITPSILKSPRLICGCDSDLRKLPINAFKFWEKTCLEPIRDKHDVRFITILPTSPLKPLSYYKTFTRDLSSVYEICSLGQHRPFSSPATKRDLGLINPDLLGVNIGMNSLSRVEEQRKSYYKSVVDFIRKVHEMFLLSHLMFRSPCDCKI
jgi:hypothetical protein